MAGLGWSGRGGEGGRGEGEEAREQRRGRVEERREERRSEGEGGVGEELEELLVVAPVLRVAAEAVVFFVISDERQQQLVGPRLSLLFAQQHRHKVPRKQR